jgi:hypothetical protein
MWQRGDGHNANDFPDLEKFDAVVFVVQGEGEILVVLSLGRAMGFIPSLRAILRHGKFLLSIKSLGSVLFGQL